jgi:thiamine biosynthesis lipoprotein
MYHQASFRCMNTGVAAWVWGFDADAARAALREAEQTFRTAHARFTRFDPASELSALNASAGRPFPASPELFEVVELAVQFSAQTGGLFNPAILGALEAWGYDRTFDEIKQPAYRRDGRSHASAAPVGCSVAVPDPVHRTITLPPGVRLDLGGIAKGWTAQRAAGQLARYGPCLVDAGGDVMTHGLVPGQSAWRIEVADPFDPERDLLTLRLHDGAVATSGVDRRRWTLNGADRHHLIDPRSGRPSDSNLLTVTLIAPTTVEAEVYAKVVFLLGGEAGLRFVEARPALAALLVTRDGRLIPSTRLEDYLDVRFAEFVAA